QSREWAGAMEGDPPARSAVDAAVTRATQELSRSRTRAESLAEQLSRQREDLRERIDDLEAGHDVAPRPAPGRDPEVRPDGAGEAALSTALVPAVGPDAGVPEPVVAGVLEQIGLGEASGAPLWVDADGRWGAGPARGSWAKERPEFIGAGAREAARRSLLTRL